MRRIFVDTEFKNLPWTGFSEMLWVGLADESGNAWSAINADVAIDERASDFTRRVVAPRMTADEPRLSGNDLSEAIRNFCGEVDEFWAWCPTVAALAGAPFELGAQAEAAHRRYWDWDLQLLRRVVSPWPDGWPSELCDLNAAVRSVGITLPPNESAHHPRYDAIWNATVFRLLQTT